MKRKISWNTHTWVEKTTKAEILVCVCGKKYIKTRPRQATCIPCMYVEKTEAGKR